MRTISVLTALLVSACAQKYIEKTTDYRLSADQRKYVEDGTRKGLKDPESARFGEIYASRGGSLIYVCGWVNARNSFGGYVGEKPFAGILSDHTTKEGKSVKTYSLTMLASEDLMINMVQNECAARGVAL